MHCLELSNCINSPCLIALLPCRCFPSLCCLQDDKAQELNARFIAEMKQLEADIIATHKKGSWTRCVPGSAGTTATYSTCLIPGSAAGLTMRGVPYSVSI